MAEISDIKYKLNYLGCLLSQDLHSFKCHGEITRPAEFNGRLKEYSELMKVHTALWQQERGYG